MADPKLIATLSSLLGPLPDVTEEKTETHATSSSGKKSSPSPAAPALA